MMETEPTYDQHQQQQQRSTPKRNKAGEFGRPLIPFFLNEDANGETPTGGYSVNEDLFLTDEQAQQQERVFVPRGEKSIRVREFKDGYFEYKDLSFDAIQEKLTFHSPIKQQQLQQQQQASNNPQFFSQHVENNKNNSSNGNGNNNNGNGLGKTTKTSNRDHFANYERMVIPFQHKNNMTKSNDNSSSSDENKRQSDEDQREEDKKAKKKKQKKKVMVPINVQKQNVSSRNTNHLVRNHENQPSHINNQTSNQEFSSQQPNNYSIQQQPSVPAINHAAGYPQVLLMHNPLMFNSPSSPVYPKPNNTNHQLLTPSLLGINRSSISTTTASSSPNSTTSSNGLLKPSALLSQSLQSLNSTPVKSPTVSTNIPPQTIPTHHIPPQQSYDVSYLENNILPQYYQEQPISYNYAMNNGSLSNVASSEPVEQLPISQMVTSTSSTSLTEKELLSILMNDGSVNFTPEEPENLEQKHKKFAGGSWSNSPHPSEIPKPNFK